MARTMRGHEVSTEELATPTVVVSADSHAGPRLKEDLRSYCPTEHLDAFDDYARNAPKIIPDNLDDLEMLIGQAPPGQVRHLRQMVRNLQSAGQYDPDVRLRELDADGVAAEVIFHGTGNNEPLPFLPGAEDFLFSPTEDMSLATVGYQMYNRWLADFCSVAPGRLLGAAHLPMWDVKAAIAEAETVAAAGLRVINLPVPRAGIFDYDHPAWEPLWSLCEAEGMTLSTHAGAPFNGGIWAALEMTGYGSRRGMPMLIFGGVFERHPQLNLVLTEIIVRNWWTAWARELDLYWSPERFPELSKPPSEYVRDNVFLGASFPPPAEVENAIAEGYSDNFIWGRDFPHGEGTYQYPESADEANMNRACLQFAFAGVEPARTRAMVGENGVRAFRLDHDELAKVAVGIGALTLQELGTLPEIIPDGYNNCLVPHPAASGQPIGR